ncbi:MAG: UpxY family transcription antiterminator [Nitrospirota bacterium]|nr:UpxY family transcription antiterminator [Nitrospirota bacterium]
MMAETKNKNWYVLYVKSRHEFVANNELTKKDIVTFLPSVRRLRQWKDRKKWVDFPLFPGYLFINIQPHPENIVSVLKTRGAINLLSAQPGQPTPVSFEEISALQLLIESGRDIDIYPELKEGTRVRVKRGPLCGAEGTLETKHDQYMFLVNIELLGRSIGVRMYADDIEAG